MQRLWFGDSRRGILMRSKSSDQAATLVRQFKEGHPDAIAEIVRRYYWRMVGMANRLLRGLNVEPACFDGDDAVNTTLSKLCEAAKAGKIHSMEESADFWNLFHSILKRNILLARDHNTRLKRGGPGLLRSNSDGRFASSVSEGELPVRRLNRTVGILDDLRCCQPPPDVASSSKQEVERLLDLLDDPLLRTIATMRAEEYTNDEIARTLGTTTRTIERKLTIIRDVWSDYDRNH
jgi:RNA polymerase sigma factor (sigma-70 family)